MFCMMFSNWLCSFIWFIFYTFLGPSSFLLFLCDRHCQLWIGATCSHPSWSDTAVLSCAPRGLSRCARYPLTLLAEALNPSWPTTGPPWCTKACTCLIPIHKVYVWHWYRQLDIAGTLNPCVSLPYTKGYTLCIWMRRERLWQHIKIWQAGDENR